MKTEFKLDHPIKGDGGREITTISVRRPRVKDIETMEEEPTNLKRSIRLLSLVAELSGDEVRALDGADFNRISEAVADFLG
ncbi:MAG: phage tail assembly protein [Candidatus Sedimenticola sp. (ex Thyasira tokunagai)]